jgi:hypothetical protein
VRLPESVHHDEQQDNLLVVSDQHGVLIIPSIPSSSSSSSSSISNREETEFVIVRTEILSSYLQDVRSLSDIVEAMTRDNRIKRLSLPVNFPKKIYLADGMAGEYLGIIATSRNEAGCCYTISMAALLNYTDATKHDAQFSFPSFLRLPIKDVKDVVPFGVDTLAVLTTGALSIISQWSSYQPEDENKTDGCIFERIDVREAACLASEGTFLYIGCRAAPYLYAYDLTRKQLSSLPVTRLYPVQQIFVLDTAHLLIIHLLADKGMDADGDRHMTIYSLAKQSQLSIADPCYASIEEGIIPRYWLSAGMPGGVNPKSMRSMAFLAASSVPDICILGRRITSTSSDRENCHCSEENHLCCFEVWLPEADEGCAAYPLSDEYRLQHPSSNEEVEDEQEMECSETYSLGFALDYTNSVSIKHPSGDPQDTPLPAAPLLWTLNISGWLLCYQLVNLDLDNLCHITKSVIGQYSDSSARSQMPKTTAFKELSTNCPDFEAVAQSAVSAPAISSAEANDAFLNDPILCDLHEHSPFYPPLASFAHEVKSLDEMHQKMADALRHFTKQGTASIPVPLDEEYFRVPRQKIDAMMDLYMTVQELERVASKKSAEKQDCFSTDETLSNEGLLAKVEARWLHRQFKTLQRGLEKVAQKIDLLASDLELVCGDGESLIACPTELESVHLFQTSEGSSSVAVPPPPAFLVKKAITKIDHDIETLGSRLQSLKFRQQQKKNSKPSKRHSFGLSLKDLTITDDDPALKHSPGTPKATSSISSRWPDKIFPPPINKSPLSLHAAWDNLLLQAKALSDADLISHATVSVSRPVQHAKSISQKDLLSSYTKKDLELLPEGLSKQSMASTPLLAMNGRTATGITSLPFSTAPMTATPISSLNLPKAAAIVPESRSKTAGPPTFQCDANGPKGAEVASASLSSIPQGPEIIISKNILTSKSADHKIVQSDSKPASALSATAWTFDIAASKTTSKESKLTPSFFLDTDLSHASITPIKHAEKLSSIREDTVTSVSAPTNTSASTKSPHPGGNLEDDKMGDKPGAKNGSQAVLSTTGFSFGVVKAPEQAGVTAPTSAFTFGSFVTPSTSTSSFSFGNQTKPSVSTSNIPATTMTLPAFSQHSLGHSTTSSTFGPVHSPPTFGSASLTFGFNPTNPPSTFGSIPTSNGSVNSISTQPIFGQPSTMPTFGQAAGLTFGGGSTFGTQSTSPQPLFSSTSTAPFGRALPVTTFGSLAANTNVTGNPQGSATPAALPKSASFSKFRD